MVELGWKAIVMIIGGGRSIQRGLYRSCNTALPVSLGDAKRQSRGAARNISLTASVCVWFTMISARYSSLMTWGIASMMNCFLSWQTSALG